MTNRYYFVSYDSAFGPVNSPVAARPGQTVEEAVDDDCRRRGLVRSCDSLQVRPITAAEYRLLGGR